MTVQLILVKKQGTGSASPAFDLSNASYDSVSLGLSGIDTFPPDFVFSSSGDKMYMIGFNTDSVHQFSLGTDWDLSTAVDDSVAFDLSNEGGSPVGIAFSSNGSKMFFVDLTNDEIYQYTLLTAWDISSASYDSVSFSIAAQETNARGIEFSANGNKMFIFGTDNNTIFQYTLGTNWDLSTASYDSVSFSLTGQDSDPRGIGFSSSGDKLYMVGNTTDSVYQYSLPTPWNVSTVNYDSVSFSIAAQDDLPWAIEFSEPGDKMYMLGNTTDSVYQYSSS